MRWWSIPRCLLCGAAPDGTEGLCRACLAGLFRGEPPAPAGLCALCGQTLLGEQGRCEDCARREWSFSRLDGLVPYQSSGGRLLRVYKGQGTTALAAFWADLAVARLDPPGPLVPVAPHPEHLRRRGWDPVGRFCRELARRAKLPVWPVLRRRPTASQKSLGREARVGNAERSYCLVPGAARRLAGVPLVWLVDDVVTTGSTVEACAAVLRRAGVREVRVLCLCLH